MSLYDDSEETVAPANPTTGRKRLYHKSGGLYILDSSGIETRLATGTGTASGTNTGDETAARIATINHGTSAKPVLVDADELTGQDSAASFGLIRTTMANIATYLATKLNTVFAQLGGSASQAFSASTLTATTLYQGTKNVPYILDQTAYISGILSSGSIANNGALTLTTALPSASITQGYFYYPANSIAAGVAAGLYWTVFSDTTHGTIYNNTYTSGSLAAPVSPTAFVTTGPGAFTQSTSVEVTLYSVVVPGGAIGAMGSIATAGIYIIPGNTNTKTMFVRLGGQLAASTSPTVATTLGFDFSPISIRNKGVQNLQVCRSAMTVSGQTAIPNFLTVDTSTNQNLSMSGLIGTATDYVIFSGATVEVFPSL